MKKQNLLTKLKRTLLLVGILTLSLGATGCSKAADVVETSIAVEATAETKDFSMKLETLSPEDLASFQSEADAVLGDTIVKDDGSIVNTPNANNKLLETMKSDMRAGLLVREDIDWLCDTQLPGADEAYMASAKKELNSICDELDSTKEGLSESQPIKETQASKPKETQTSKPKETTSVPKETQATQPTQSPDNGMTTKEGQAAIDADRAAMKDPEFLEEAEKSVIDGEATGKPLTDEEKAINIQ